MNVQQTEAQQFNFKNMQFFIQSVARSDIVLVAGFRLVGQSVGCMVGQLKWGLLSFIGNGGTRFSEDRLD